MLTLNDGRSELWQWDTGRKLTVDADCSQVHFSNKVFGRSIDVDVGGGVAIIPDILLQTDKELTAWAFVGTSENGYTKISKVFKVNRRNKPADYVFTPPEQTTLGEILERLDDVESAQDPDAIKNAVDDYLANNPIKIDEKDPTVPNWAKQTSKPKYTAKEVGAVATVNGTSPDENGNVQIKVPDSVEGAVLYTEQELTEEQKAQARANIGFVEVEPAEDDIPKVFFTGTAPTTKAEDELPLIMEYRSKTESFKDYVTLKVQGDSSSGYPKKNFNLKMFTDADRAQKDKRVFRDWSKTHKYCLKANWIDHTHARNVVNGRLWGQVVRSRSDFGEYPAEYRESANCGAVNGFPVKVYLNGVYQGLYTWNIRKDESMFNMDDSTGTQAALIADANNNVTLWRGLPAIDGTDWTDELNDTVPDAVKTSFQNLYKFVMESTDEEFKANIGNYFYLSSLIDYYIFVHAIYMMGGFCKSQTMFTYDATKYLANIYDMDTTWALYWDGSDYYTVNGDVSNSGTGDSSNLLYARLETLFPDEIKTRYAELRETVLSEANIINEFERFMDVIPSDLYAEDFASTTANGAFVNIPSKNTNNLQKLREIIVERLAYCDSMIPNLGNSIPVLYELEETAFTGSGDGINTGVCLFDEPKSFTITADFTSEAVNATCIFGTMDGDIPDCSSLLVKTYTGSGTTLVNIVDMNSKADVANFQEAMNASARLKVAIVFVDGLPSACMYRLSTRDFNQTLTPNSKTFKAQAQPLYIGAIRRVSYGGFWEHWTGTMHSFKIYDGAMTTEQIEEFLNG
jgi:hypothetical protein